MKSCADRYEKAELDTAVSYCIARDLWSATDFRDALEYFKTDESKQPAADYKGRTAKFANTIDRAYERGTDLGLPDEEFRAEISNAFNKWLGK